MQSVAARLPCTLRSACAASRPEGRASVVFRCRSVGVHPDLDIYGVEDQVREWWPDEAGRKLRSFAEAGESMEGAVRQGAAEEGDRAGPDDV